METELENGINRVLHQKTTTAPTVQITFCTEKRVLPPPRGAAPEHAQKNALHHAGAMRRKTPTALLEPCTGKQTSENPPICTRKPAPPSQFVHTGKQEPGILTKITNIMLYLCAKSHVDFWNGQHYNRAIKGNHLTLKIKEDEKNESYY